MFGGQPKTFGKASEVSEGLPKTFGKAFPPSLTAQGFVAPVGFDDVTAALQDLPAVDEAGGQEVNAGLQPEGLVFPLHFVQRGPHAVDAHVAVDAEGRWEQVREVAPEGRDGRGGPRDARKEQQRHGGEDEQQHARLAVADGDGGRHGEEDAGAQVFGGEDAICMNEPDAEAEEKLEALGKELAAL